MKTLFKLTAVTLLLALLTACASTSTTKSTGQTIDDAVIETRVKTALIRDDRVRAIDIEVEVFKGVVQLSGWVDSNEQVRIAEDLAINIPGVVDVKNRLDVKR